MYINISYINMCRLNKTEKKITNIWCEGSKVVRVLKHFGWALVREPSSMVKGQRHNTTTRQQETKSTALLSSISLFKYRFFVQYILLKHVCLLPCLYLYMIVLLYFCCFVLKYQSVKEQLSFANTNVEKYTWHFTHPVIYT
jgi:hypothetical protein